MKLFATMQVAHQAGKRARHGANADELRGALELHVSIASPGCSLVINAPWSLLHGLNVAGNRPAEGRAG
jgi:hypothetical protein